MDIDVRIGNESITINIENPYRLGPSGIIKNIVDFGMKFKVDLDSLEIEKLLKRMIKGVAGCENGCPADAKALGKAGFGNFKISYIEGGILSARCVLENGIPLEVKLFPEFN